MKRKSTKLPKPKHYLTIPISVSNGPSELPDLTLADIYELLPAGSYHFVTPIIKHDNGTVIIGERKIVPL